MAQRTPPSIVLIVDGNDDIRSTLRALLEDEGYTVLEAETPSEVMATLLAVPDCIVVLFSNTEPTDHPALTFFTDIAANPALATRHAYIYLTTIPHLVSPALAVVLATLGAPILAKPFDIARLLAAVATAAARLSS